LLCRGLLLLTGVHLPHGRRLHLDGRVPGGGRLLRGERLFGGMCLLRRRLLCLLLLSEGGGRRSS
jgi:hypothetical protein